MLTIKMDQSNPATESVYEIAGLLKSGAVIAYPTDTFYGLGADIYNQAAIERIFEIKGRVRDKPILILIHDREMLTSLVLKEGIPDFAYRLIDRLWPGPLTIVFFASEKIHEVLTGRSGKIGIRLPDHTFCRRLVEALGRPVTATSANISGMPSLNNPEDVLEAIGDRIDAIVDGGITQGESESTVVDVTGAEPVVLREGAIPLSRIKEIAAGEGI